MKQNKIRMEGDNLTGLMGHNPPTVNQKIISS
jgi:hypothetical protein